MNNTKLEQMISKAAEGAILKEMMTLEVAVKLIEAVENKAKEIHERVKAECLEECRAKAETEYLLQKSKNEMTNDEER